MSSPRSDAGRTAVAALVALHLVAITLMSFPAPVGGMDRRTWADPTVQAEFAAWRGRLEAIGVRTTKREFEDGLFAVARSVMSARDAALAPFDLYYQWFGTWQSWRMFVAPHTHPARLVVEIEEGGAWREVFRERSPEAMWLRPLLAQDRTRSVIFRYSWPNFRGSWRKLAHWIAARAAVDFPDAARARVWFERVTTPSAAEVRAGEAPEPERTQVLEFTLSELR